MTKWRASVLLLLISCGCLISPLPVFASTLVFVNSREALRDVYSLKAPTNKDEIPIFKGGDAIFGVLRLDNPKQNLASITIPRDGARVLKLAWSYENRQKEFTLIAEQEIHLTEEQARSDVLIFTLVPDAFDLSTPGFERFLASINVSDTGHAELNNALVRPQGQVVFKVRLENEFDIRDFEHNDAKKWEWWQQSVFLLDLSAGAGRYAEWKTRRSESYAQQEQEEGDAICKPKQNALPNEHARGEVRSLAVSPDGRLLASAHSSGGTLWDLRTGQALAYLPHKTQVNSVAFSADGTMLALAGGVSQGTQCGAVWSVPESRPLRGFLERNNFNAIASVDLSPDGRYLLSGGLRFALWEIASGKLLKWGPVDTNTEPGGKPPYGFVRAAFSPNGKTIATVDWFGDGSNGAVRIYEAATANYLGSLRGYSKAIEDVAFSPDGKLLATAGEDGKVRVWDLATAAEKYDLGRESDLVSRVRFSRDGAVLVSASGETLTLRKVATGQDFLKIKANESTWAVAFRADGKALFSGGKSGTIIEWDTKTGKPLRRFPATSGLILP